MQDFTNNRILVSPSAELHDDEVMFEFTALPHIVWDKDLDVNNHVS